MLMNFPYLMSCIPCWQEKKELQYETTQGGIEGHCTVVLLVDRAENM